MIPTVLSNDFSVSLDVFRSMQEQRDHRHAMKNYLKELQEAQSTDKPRKSRFEPVPPPLPPSLARGVAPPMDCERLKQNN